MTALANAMLVVFIAAWCVCVLAWFYAVRFFMPMWLVGFRKRERHNGYVRKTLVGTGVFIVAWAIAFSAGLIAEFWGGGWN